MRITSYNVTDAGYHYIGLRVLAAMPTANREEQMVAVSRNVLKYARDKALRLMLPEARGSFETVGEKVCNELLHFRFAEASPSKGYQLTTAGKHATSLLNEKRHAELRRTMIAVHLATYDNLREIVQRHIELGGVWSPIVESSGLDKPGYVESLLRPTFRDKSRDIAASIAEEHKDTPAKKLEDALRERVLVETFDGHVTSVPLFRSICDRLVSLRLLNIMKISVDGAEFAKSYSPCMAGADASGWHRKLEVQLGGGKSYSIALSEPDMDSPQMHASVLHALDEAFAALPSQAGYFDLPDVRDFACERLRVPEAAFDEGVNKLLDQQPSPLTVGLTYERISGRRKPLVRARESTQVFNLLRRA